VPRFAAGQESLMLGPDSAVDLIVERKGGGLYCAGLNVKVMNDHVPLVLFPGSPDRGSPVQDKTQGIVLCRAGHIPGTCLY
jgi:hypothetical protein